MQASSGEAFPVFSKYQLPASRGCRTSSSMAHFFFLEEFCSLISYFKNALLFQGGVSHRNFVDLDVNPNRLKTPVWDKQHHPPALTVKTWSGLCRETTNEQNHNGVTHTVHHIVEITSWLKATQSFSLLCFHCCVSGCQDGNLLLHRHNICCLHFLYTFYLFLFTACFIWVW